MSLTPHEIQAVCSVLRAPESMENDQNLNRHHLSGTVFTEPKCIQLG